MVATAAAQTFVVDAANGPGTGYTTIADAVAGVPDGAVLKVRPGNYTQDALWLDGNSTSFLSFGVFAPGAPVTATLPWPGTAVPAVRAVWQGAALDANGALQLSNPSLTILP